MKSLKNSLYIPVIASLIIGTSNVSMAQTNLGLPTGTNTTKGVAGFMDKDNRAPTITLSTSTDGENTKILVDTTVPNSDLDRYPIEVKYFINGNFYTSQIRTNELPKPLGIDIGPDVAQIPFNYSIVASILHPNRRFSSLAQGAILPPTPTPTPTVISDDDIIDNNDNDNSNDNSSLNTPVSYVCDVSQEDVAGSGNLTTLAEDTTVEFARSNNGLNYTGTISGTGSNNQSIDITINFNLGSLEGDEIGDTELSGSVEITPSNAVSNASSQVDGSGELNASSTLEDIDLTTVESDAMSIQTEVVCDIEENRALNLLASRIRK